LAVYWHCNYTGVTRPKGLELEGLEFGAQPTIMNRIRNSLQRDTWGKAGVPATDKVSLADGCIQSASSTVPFGWLTAGSRKWEMEMFQKDGNHW
jgi:hypothetical protein